MGNAETAAPNKLTGGYAVCDRVGFRQRVLMAGERVLMAGVGGGLAEIRARRVGGLAAAVPIGPRDRIASAEFENGGFPPFFASAKRYVARRYVARSPERRGKASFQAASPLMANFATSGRGAARRGGAWAFSPIGEGGATPRDADRPLHYPRPARAASLRKMHPALAIKLWRLSPVRRSRTFSAINGVGGADLAMRNATRNVGPKNAAIDTGWGASAAFVFGGRTGSVTLCGRVNRVN